MAKIGLDHACLVSTSFDQANLIQANLSHVHAEGASFRLAEMEKVTLSAATLTGADFRGSDLSGAHLESIAQNPTGESIAQNPTAISDAAPSQKPQNPWEEYCKGKLRTDLTQAILTGAHLEGADLTCAILRGAILDRQTILDGTILDHTDFCGAHLDSVDLSKAKKVETARFSSADIRNAIFPISKAPEGGVPALHADKAFVAGAKFEHSHLENADLRDLSLKDPGSPDVNNTSACDSYVPPTRD